MPSETRSAGWGERPGQFARIAVLSAAVMVFVACLTLAFNKAAGQYETALRDAGANIRLAFVTNHEMQQLRHAFDLYALRSEAEDGDRMQSHLQRVLYALDRLTEQPSPPALALVRLDLIELAPALKGFVPGDPAQHAELAERLDQIAVPLHRTVTNVEAIGLNDMGRADQRRQLFMEEALYLFGMLGSGGIFIALLLGEGRRTRRLLEEATAAQGRIEHLAHHDPLTDLPNRWLFKDRLDQALRMAHRQNGMVAMHCVDLDYFKSVNDRFGHVTGDKMLVAVADRMRACLRDSDTLARLGGDEFAIVQAGITQDGADHLAERLLEALRLPLFVDGQEVMPTVSIGIGLYPIHGGTAEELHRAADAALYCAKAAGRDRYHLWQPGDGRAGLPHRYRALAG
ncbi:MAG: diguanylate cyclase [Pseudomonadota bacterium]